MKKIFTILVSFFFMSHSLIAEESVQKQTLTVWIRSFGNSSASLITPYLEQIEKEFLDDFDLTILVATKPQDPVLTVLKDLRLHCPLIVLQTNLNSISQGLNSLIDATLTNSYVLVLSQGVEIHANHVKEASIVLENGAWAHGWQISKLQNDGSVPGKGWYHTAALYPPSTLLWMKSHPFPYWVDNGVDGYLTIGEESIPIGGNEEVALMGMAIQSDPTAFFIHDNRNILNLAIETGTGITFEQKLKRKTLVGNYYLEHRFQMDPADVWRHLFLID